MMKLNTVLYNLQILGCFADGVPVFNTIYIPWFLNMHLLQRAIYGTSMQDGNLIYWQLN